MNSLRVLLNICTRISIFRFISSGHLPYIVSGEIYDIVGVITFVGRMERMREKEPKDYQTSGNYWMSRWIRVSHGQLVADHPIIYSPVYNCSW